MAGKPAFTKPPIQSTLEEDDADVGAADPVDGRTDAPARQVSKARQLVAGSVTWDLNATQRLGALVAVERGLTRRALHNVLLADFLALPARERRATIDRAIAWERDTKP